MFAIIRGLAPTIIVVLIAGLLLGAGVLVVLGLALTVALIAVAARHQKTITRQRYGSRPLDDWMSRTGVYEGPFDATGLPGAANLMRWNNRFTVWGKVLAVRMLVTDDGLVIGPADNPDIASPLMVPFQELRCVDLVKGAHPRRLVVMPPTASEVGQVVVTTTDGHVARFSGISIEGLEKALEQKGAAIGMAS